MVKHFSRELVAEQARIVETPVKHHEVDRTFELPRGLYVATVGLYLGFIAVMAAGLPSSGLAIPMVIFAYNLDAPFARNAFQGVQLRPAQDQGHHDPHGPPPGARCCGAGADPAGHRVHLGVGGSHRRIAGAIGEGDAGNAGS